MDHLNRLLENFQAEPGWGILILQDAWDVWKDVDLPSGKLTDIAIWWFNGGLMVV